MRVALITPEGARGPVSADDLVALLEDAGASVERVAADVGAAALSAADRVVVAGGDGAVGPGAAVARAAGLPLAVAPIGTANDFARRLGIPLDVVAACRLAVTGRLVRELDLARAGERPFVNVASAGLAPTAARLARPWRHAVGPLAYAVSAAVAGAAARPVGCRVCCDGETLFDGDAWQVIVANGGGFGGGSRVAADPADGLLDVVVVPAASRLRLIGHARALRRGDIAVRPGVHITRAVAVDLTLQDGAVNVDGDLMEAPALHVGLEPRAVSVVVG